MNRLLGLLLLLPIWLFQPTEAHAQTSVALYCFTGTAAPQWLPCQSSNPLAVNATFSGTVSSGATAAAALPSLSAGSAAIYESLSGGQYINPIFGTTIVDLTHGLPIQPMTASTWPLPTGAATAALQTTINTTLGSPFQAGGSIGNTAFGAQPTPVTSGGLSVYFVQPTASDNHAVIKAGAGQVYKISVTNNSATVNYIRLYNATTGFNGCNSATNLVYENAIPASTTVGGLADQWEMGMAFSTGISICVTSGYATNDTTNATATAMNVNIGWK